MAKIILPSEKCFLSLGSALLRTGAGSKCLSQNAVSLDSWQMFADGLLNPLSLAKWHDWLSLGFNQHKHTDAVTEATAFSPEPSPFAYLRVIHKECLPAVMTSYALCSGAQAACAWLSELESCHRKISECQSPFSLCLPPHHQRRQMAHCKHNRKPGKCEPCW